MLRTQKRRSIATIMSKHSEFSYSCSIEKEKIIEKKIEEDDLNIQLSFKYLIEQSIQFIIHTGEFKIHL